MGLIARLSKQKTGEFFQFYLLLCVCSGDVGRQGRGAVIEGFPNEPIVAAITKHIKGRMDKMRDGGGR